MIFDLAGQLRALVEGEVRFIVIGAIAVAAHAIIRATEDVDLVPDPDAENLDRLCTVLADLDARLLLNPQRTIDARARLALEQGRNVTVTTRLATWTSCNGYREYRHSRRSMWTRSMSRSSMCRFASARASISSP